MFKARIGDPRNLSPPPEDYQSGDAGKKCKLQANSFRITTKAPIHQYQYEISPRTKPGDEKRVLEQVWSDMAKQLGSFVVQCPCFIFSPVLVQSTLTFNASEAVQVLVNFVKSFDSSSINDGLSGEAEVVAQQIIKKLAPQNYQRVGRRYFQHDDNPDQKAQIVILSGFCAALAHGSGPLLQVDMMYRALHKRSILESIGDESLALSDPECVAEWQRRCNGATAVTTYNPKTYRIKAVHFDKFPNHIFKMYDRPSKTSQEMSIAEYYKGTYDKKVEMRQPLLEAYPEKPGETIFLLPELCYLTGFNDEMRKDKNLMTEALKTAKVTPVDRLSALKEVAQEMGKVCREVDSDATEGMKEAHNFVKEWRVEVAEEPLETEARTLEPLDVTFNGSKPYKIEEGNFQRCMRNGLQCPTKFDDWLFIYPESDVPVLDIWLRSLRDIAQVAFQMKMSEPRKIPCTEQREKIIDVLKNQLTPSTQMVLLLTPQKDCKKVYQLFKAATCSKEGATPCVTQVVKSETVRKRQSIAAILSRIVLQINAKFCGPLWHVTLSADPNKALLPKPTMVIGIDIHRSCDKEDYLGFTASLDTQCTEYFSMASSLQSSKDEHTDDDDAKRGTISVKMQKYLRDAILDFSKRNDGLLPEHFVVYRASMCQAEWSKARVYEIGAIREVIKKFAEVVPKYQPRLTFIAISKHVGARFFLGYPENVRNPEPGTVVDSSVIANRCGLVNFYLVNQQVSKGTAIPTHYTVLEDSDGCGSDPISPNVLQNLTYRLSFLYFNYTGSVKMPAPAQYAKKISHLVATAVRSDPHQRLVRTFFYL